jgi:predicted HTH domain antitoxin
MSTCQLTIEYPEEVLWALHEQPEEFTHDARRLLALKLYESGKLSTGLAARLAGMDRVEFMFELSRAGLSPFGETADELAEDLERARAASRL